MHRLEAFATHMPHSPFDREPAQQRCPGKKNVTAIAIHERTINMVFNALCTRRNRKWLRLIEQQSNSVARVRNLQNKANWLRATWSLDNQALK